MEGLNGYQYFTLVNGIRRFMVEEEFEDYFYGVPKNIGLPYELYIPWINIVNIEI